MEQWLQVEDQVKAHVKSNLNFHYIHLLNISCRFRKGIRQTVLGRHSGTDLLAFFVTLTQTAENLGWRHNILFDNIVTNVGNGYNQHLDGFSAPVSGMYVLMSTLMSLVGYKSNFQLVRNDNTVCHMYVGGIGSGNYESSGGSYVLLLNKGK
ncbi:hypothetical protein DPMN_063860 [Dreissena polymorpha]|uniref:C1q domain-containing protein n=1 Tax=Dreissena polymorpha TaxID=45954 RepID=A0A9D4HKN1_DREPO|nr:hypothetical protein DPMN_063860 [Dreissena polymorpha]